MLNAILPAELEGKGVLGQPEVPGLSAAQMQEKMEELTRAVVIPAFNRMVDQQNKENDDRYTKLETETRINQKVADIGAGDMAKAVYDPQGKATDIFAAIPGRDLLDNSDFSNPVNQRGQTVYAAAGHTVDRWLKDAAGTVTVSDGKIILTRSDATSAHYFYQRAPKEKVKSGNTYTLSVGLANGTVYTLTAVLASTVAEKITPFGRVTFVMLAGFAQVLIDYGKDSLELAFVKFEESPFPTPYVPKGYGVELAECQRYGRVAFISIGAERSINTMLNYDMRIVPTFAVLNQIAGTFYPVFSNVTKQFCEVSIPNHTINYWVGTYFLSADL